MTIDQVTLAIQVLTDVVKANRGLLGSEKTANEANEKIRQLIKLIPSA